MSHILKIALLILLSAGCLHASGQERRMEQSASAPASPQLDVHRQEVAALKRELEITKSFQESILGTVYWALGGTFVISGLLLGFGWHANFRVYERDKASMRAELEALMTTKLSDIESSLIEKTNTIPEIVSSNVKTSLDQHVKSIKSSINSLSNKIFDLEYRYLSTKMHSNPSDNMAMTDALRLLQLCIPSDPSRVPDIIHFMLKKIDKGGKLTAIEITELHQALDSLPSHYSTLTEKLRAKVVASDIF